MIVSLRNVDTFLYRDVSTFCLRLKARFLEDVSSFFRIAIIESGPKKYGQSLFSHENLSRTPFLIVIYGINISTMKMFSYQNAFYFVNVTNTE